MVYLWVFIGLVSAIILLSIANVILKVVRNKKKQKKGEE